MEIMSQKIENKALGVDKDSLKASKKKKEKAMAGQTVYKRSVK